MARVSKFLRVRTFRIVSNSGLELKDTLLIDPDVHLDDVCDAFILLTEEALKPNGGNAQWCDEGYYFAEAGGFVRLPSCDN